jgi:hypothetical protein
MTTMVAAAQHQHPSTTEMGAGSTEGPLSHHLLSTLLTSANQPTNLINGHTSSSPILCGSRTAICDIFLIAAYSLAVQQCHTLAVPSPQCPNVPESFTSVKQLHPTSLSAIICMPNHYHYRQDTHLAVPQVSAQLHNISIHLRLRRDQAQLKAHSPTTCSLLCSCLPTNQLTSSNNVNSHTSSSPILCGSRTAICNIFLIAAYSLAIRWSHTLAVPSP